MDADDPLHLNQWERRELEIACGWRSLRAGWLAVAALLCLSTVPVARGFWLSRMDRPFASPVPAAIAMTGEKARDTLREADTDVQIAHLNLMNETEELTFHLGRQMGAAETSPGAVAIFLLLAAGLFAFILLVRPKHDIRDPLIRKLHAAWEEREADR